MLRAPTLFTLLSDSLACLSGHLPGIRNGEDDAIHQARVEIRRTREVVALAGALDDSDGLRRVDHLLQRAGRTLGRARDADVVVEHVQDLEARFRHAASVMTLLRAATDERRHRMRRKTVRMLERADVERLPAEITALRRSGGLRRASRGQVRHAVRDHVAARAADLRTAIAHAGGVRFSGRLHDVRIAAKRLRYALELADRLAVPRPAGARRVLKQVQESLGALRDRDVLLDTIRQMDLTRPDLTDQRAMIEQFVMVDANRAHARYLSQRPELLSVCAACEGSGRRWSVNRAALAAAGVAVPSLMLLIGRRSQRRDASPATGQPGALAS